MGSTGHCANPDVLLIILEPDEGFSLRFNVRSPADESRVDSQALHFRYSDVYDELPPALPDIDSRHPRG